MRLKCSDTDEETDDTAIKLEIELPSCASCRAYASERAGLIAIRDAAQVVANRWLTDRTDTYEAIRDLCHALDDAKDSQ